MLELMVHLLKVFCSLTKKQGTSYSLGTWNFNPEKKPAVAKDKYILRIICFLNIITITFLSIFKEIH